MDGCVYVDGYAWMALSRENMFWSLLVIKGKTDCELPL